MKTKIKRLQIKFRFVNLENEKCKLDFLKMNALAENICPGWKLKTKTCVFLAFRRNKNLQRRRRKWNGKTNDYYLRRSP